MKEKRKKIIKKSQPKSRKELRKEKRNVKKIHRQEFFSKKSKNTIPTNIDKNEKEPRKKNQKRDLKPSKPKQESVADVMVKHIEKEKKDKLILDKEMRKQRKKQLLKANETEDKNIKKLEKQLKLNKRKSKNIAQAFSSDGLDYILELCDGDTIGDAAKVEQQFFDSNLENEFEDDFAIATGKKEHSETKKKDTKKVNSNKKIDIDSGSNNEDFDESDLDSIDNFDESNESLGEEEDFSDFESDLSEMDEEIPKNKKVKGNLKRKHNESSDFEDDKKPNKKSKGKEDEDINNSVDDFDSNESNSEEEAEKSGEWEDIYGRKRDETGKVVESQSKYVPPALRAKFVDSDSEKVQRLRKQIKGLLNRLTEANLVNISHQIENLYANGEHSRHNLNTVLSGLIIDSLVTYSMTPPKTISDHALLIGVLHANIDIEIGANFLQTIIEKFDNLIQKNNEIENKEMENCVHLISQLYNLKLFHCNLIHEILKKLVANDLTEQNLESTLIILRTVGPTLRKDDPISLKDTILHLQSLISNVTGSAKESSRLKFMLDILMAIKNNNFTKIPNYSPDDVERMRKVLRAALRKGNYVTELNIGLEDILKVEERGKWWVVGSAWSGKEEKTKLEKGQSSSEVGYSAQLLELARKQRMNTDVRRNIFCIIMSAEDYLDAFEKLLHLGLRGQSEREIIHVLIHCCLQERNFNPYYAVLTQKFCDYDRRFQMCVQCTVWDKIRDISNISNTQITNLAKFLTHLFLKLSIPISMLKVIELGELSKPLLRLLRQTLLGVLLNKDMEAVVQVWERVGNNASFKQGLRLFIHHFLLRGTVNQNLSDSDRQLLEERSKIADKALSSSNKRINIDI